MRAGLMRHRLTFQTFTDVPNTRGGSARTWLDSFSCWGQMTVATPTKPGTEQLTNDRPVAAVTWDFVTRWNSVTATLTERQRFTASAWPGKTFEIVSITNVDGRNAQLAGQAVEIDE